MLCKNSDKFSYVSLRRHYTSNSVLNQRSKTSEFLFKVHDNADSLFRYVPSYYKVVGRYYVLENWE